jgi:hypothetical protein
MALHALLVTVLVLGCLSIVAEERLIVVLGSSAGIYTRIAFAG